MDLEIKAAISYLKSRQRINGVHDRLGDTISEEARSGIMSGLEVLPTIELLHIQR